jgi:hypothetical protein
MKNNFSIKFKVFDVFILIFAVISIVATIVTTNIVFGKDNNKIDDRVVCIYHKNDLVKEIKVIDINGKIDYKLTKEEFNDLRGDMIISIDKDKGVCISEVVCPNHLCVNMGWVNKKGIPVVCLPNNVYVIISSSSSIDQDIELM